MGGYRRSPQHLPIEGSVALTVRVVFLAIGAAISGSDAEQPVDKADLALCSWFFEDAMFAAYHAHDLETLELCNTSNRKSATS